MSWLISTLVAAAALAAGPDLRNIRTGHRIPDEGYCDQPYTVVTRDGNWLCTLTTGPGREGARGQHVVATISADQGRTWSELIDIEPSGPREASWAMPLVTPSGRVYVFYTYNADNIHELNGKPIRADTLGYYVFKYSDDNGRTWSKRRYRLPMRVTAVDRGNQFGGKVLCFWGIGKPIVAGRSVLFAFSKVGRLVVDNSEGWFFRSDNILYEAKPESIRWQMLPDGDHGLRDPKLGQVHAEQNLVALDDGSLYCMYRTGNGYPCHAYSRDGGHSWTRPVYATYRPGGRRMKNPRACPRIWRTRSGRFLFWFHNHSDVSGGGWKGRNPAWVCGGVERNGHIYWSQPEILLYDPDPAVRMSYPDLIEQDGGYWVTETQKTIARVHRIDPTLLEGLWSQGRARSVARDGLIVELDRDQTAARAAVELPGQLQLSATGGVTVDCWVSFDDLSAGQVLLDTRAADGRGLALVTTRNGAVQILFSDGKNEGRWECDSGLLRVGKLHHVVAIVDAGPRIISFVIDGQLCDGGRQRPYGWGRYASPVGNVAGTGTLRLAPRLNGRLHRLRIYGRYLRSSEAIANYHAGP